MCICRISLLFYIGHIDIMNELPKMYDKVNKLQLCSINNYHLDSNTSFIIEKKTMTHMMTPNNDYSLNL